MGSVEPELRRRRNADDTRTVVLNAAARVFRDRGYAGTRLSDVAEEAGLKAGSLYYHFGSRDELVTEVLRLSQVRMTGAVTGALDELGPRAPALERLRAAVRAQVLEVMTNSDYAMAGIRMRGQVPREILDPQVAPQAEYFDIWRRLIREAQASDGLRWDLDELAVRLLLTGATNWLPNWYRTGGTHPADTVADQFVDLFFAGLAAAKPARFHMPFVPPEIDPQPPTATGGPRKRRTTRARILDAAATTFRTHGYAGTRLVDVASAAGMKTGSLYYHFESREDLVAELMRLATEISTRYVRACADALPSGASPLDRLCTAMSGHLYAVLGSGWEPAPNPYVMAVNRIFGQVPPDVDKVSQDGRSAYAAYFRNLFAEATASGEIRGDLDPAIARETILGALSWSAEWYQPEGRFRPSDIARMFIGASLDGLGTITRAGAGRS